jgi:rhodanese-related sulfurtransferase
MSHNPFSRWFGASPAGLAAPEDDWAEVSRHNRGIPEITVQQVSNLMGAVRLVDVREPDELVGALGAIGGAENVPLRSLRQAAEPWSREQPVVVLCRSGGRSAGAALQLEAMGFKRVASMAGGMLEWHAHRLPLASSLER